VRNGDMISLDVNARTINLDVPEAKSQNAAPHGRRREPRYERGYAGCSPATSRATEGCDFDFSRPVWGAGRGAVDLLIYPSFRGAKNLNPRFRLMLRITPE
jgi:hypothetical protein